MNYKISHELSKISSIEYKFSHELSNYGMGSEVIGGATLYRSYKVISKETLDNLYH